MIWKLTSQYLGLQYESACLWEPSDYQQQSSLNLTPERELNEQKSQSTTKKRKLEKTTNDELDHSRQTKGEQRKDVYPRQKYTKDAVDRQKDSRGNMCTHHKIHDGYGQGGNNKYFCIWSVKAVFGQWRYQILTPSHIIFQVFHFHPSALTGDANRKNWQ